MLTIELFMCSVGFPVNVFTAPSAQFACVSSIVGPFVAAMFLLFFDDDDNNNPKN